MRIEKDGKYGFKIGTERYSNSYFGDAVDKVSYSEKRNTLTVFLRRDWMMELGGDGLFLTSLLKELNEQNMDDVKVVIKINGLNGEEGY